MSTTLNIHAKPFVLSDGNDDKNAGDLVCIDNVHYDESGYYYVSFRGIVHLITVKIIFIIFYNSHSEL